MTGAHPPATPHDPSPRAADRSIPAVRRALAAVFREAGLDSPELDARLLVGHVLRLDHAALAASTWKLTGEELARLEALAARRLAREPIARIVGRKEFWGLSLAVTADVLVPRPETETVVEAALASLSDAQRARPVRIADLGTGSGALLLALLHELPQATGVATDRSIAALKVAQRNAQRLGLAPRAAFVACNYADALSGGFDLVVSNPPYIASGEIAALAADVRDYDPLLALDGGADGFDGLRAVAHAALRLLRPDGHVIVEVGAGQAADVAEIFASAGLIVNEIRADLAGIARVLTASTHAGKARPTSKKPLGLLAGND